MAKMKSKKKKWNKVLTGAGLSGVVLASTAVVTTIPLVSEPIKAEAAETITVTQNASNIKTIETSQLKVWMRDSARYGLQLKSNGATIFYSTDSAYINLISSGSFPTGLTYNSFAKLPLKSFVVNGTTIEQTRTDGRFDYIFRLSIVNATSQGAYMKAELEMENLTNSYQNVGASFNIDTMVNGNDRSPFRIIPNGWEAFNDGVQVTAYYKDVFNATNADAIYLGQYYNQYPMSLSSFYEGQLIYPGDSGAGFYYNLKSVAPYQSRKESWIMGLGPRNANPTFTMTAPADNQTFYRGQTLPISGTVQDTDIGDILELKWSVDGGAENLLTSLTANGSAQPFNYNYTLPSNLAEGWHTLQVWAMDDKGGVSSSNSKRFYVNNFVTPAAPTFANVNTDAFMVSFDKNGNVDSTTYELYKVHNGQTVNMGTGNSLEETGLLPNTLYQYKVRAKNTSSVYTSYSAISSIYTLAKQPTVGNLTTSVNGQAVISWGANGNPSGTKYHYEVRKTSDNTVVKSGDTTATSVTVTGLPTDVYYKVYVRAVNGDNVNTSEIYIGQIFQDTIAPSLSLTTNTSAWTNESVTISATATDGGTGVKSIDLPNGNKATGISTASYVVDKNGSYMFTTTDNAGNVTAKTITVSNIDKQLPTATHAIEHVKDNTYSMTITAEDSDSGIKRIKLPDGTYANSSQAVYTLKKGETYAFEIEDKAGNKLPYEVKADVPDLTVYQQGSYVKAEWAIDMLDQDIMYQTGFEEVNELPNLVYSSGRTGGQSFTTDQAFSGSRSLKVSNTVNGNGNYYNGTDLAGKDLGYSDYSLATFPNRKYVSNGTDLSLSFRAKTTGKGSIVATAQGGNADFGKPTTVKFTDKVSVGDKTVNVDNPQFFKNYIDKGQRFYISLMKGTYTYGWPVSVDLMNSTITLNTGFKAEFEPGEYVLQHQYLNPATFPTRSMTDETGWILYNMNVQVSNSEYYNTALRGFALWLRTTAYEDVYIDDVKMGYATKAQLFRGDTKIYEGLLSDYEDRAATDKTKPENVSNVKVHATQGNIFMTIQKAEDKGSEYEYNVKAISNKGDSVASEKKKAVVTSGIDGYSYVVDTSATTVPDNAVDTRSENVQIPITNNGKYYIHIKTVDKAGNASDVTHIPFQDNVAPTLSLVQNPTNWTTSTVQITADASDQGLGMKRIKLPNGTWVDGEMANYTVTANGTYTFVAEDLVGNQTTKTITVSNIDKTPPTAPSISNNQEWTKDSPVAVTITAGTDSQSGVKQVEYRLEGATVRGWTIYTGGLNVVNEGTTKIIARTVDNLGQVSQEAVSYVRIDQSVPYNTGATLKLKP